MDFDSYEHDDSHPADGNQWDSDAENAGSYEVDWYDSFDSTEFDEAKDDAEMAIPSIEQISDLLSSLTEGPTEPIAEHQFERDATASSSSSKSAAPVSVPEMDSELREAFLDDAGQCLAAIENAVIEYENDPNNHDAIRRIGRELHTLKGASASVGLAELADYLHGIEDSIGSEDPSGAGVAELPSAQDLLTRLDEVRRTINLVRGDKCAAAHDSVSESESSTPAAVPVHFDDTDDRSGDEESVRVKSSQLNRLMDMLAELVMLRNRRQTELSQLQEIYDELIQGVCQVRSLSDRDAMADNAVTLPSVANGLMATAQKLRTCSQPIAEGNETISQFIRQFRQELVELRRTPVSGLFKRLQRVVRDAARLEGKKVQLTLVGENAGIERTLQQRLYEPLLHIVRNCVCHGIESPDQRRDAGKNPTGTINLRAQSNADLFVIEITDDGQGLNYDAIRRRGLENGLLNANTSVRDSELAQLIFQPGFSTRQSADQVAGRGVGMDVVSETLKRMRGWIEIDSRSGQGTTIRLSFPLPSVIQHTMVFRSSGQLYALPMQLIQNAGADNCRRVAVRIEELLDAKSMGDPSDLATAETNLLVLSRRKLGQDPNDGEGSDITLSVDEIVGPEEVVMRPLPALLKQHPICCGATLSGLGEVVLVLDATQVMKLATVRIANRKKNSKTYLKAPSPSEIKPRPKVLVVDDSKTARLRVVSSLGRYEVDIVEAGDGEEAMGLMAHQHFSAVFSDMEMPKVDGMSLLSAVCHSKHDPPVFIISSRDEPSIRAEANRRGAAGYLIKPLVDQELDDLILTIPSLRTLVRTEGSKPSHDEQTIHSHELQPAGAQR